jgi:Glycosyltransferase family 87
MTSYDERSNDDPSHHERGMAILRPLERPAVRRAALIALVVLTIVFAVQTWRKAHRADGNDLTSYLTAARALAVGASPYDAAAPFPYIYPLFPALVLIPLAVVPYGAAVLCWFALSVAALAWTLAAFARRETPDHSPGDAVPIAAIVLFLMIEVVQNNLLNGQINFVVLACCAAALAASRPATAAIAWAAAVSTKLVPLALAPWWILRGRLLVVGAGILLVCLFALAPYLLTDTPTAVQQEYSGFLRGSLANGAPEDRLRFSLFGVLEPLLPGVPWLPLLCAVVVVSAVALADLRSGRRPDDHVAFALYLAAIPLASPKSETHHLAFALPAVYVCALRMLRYRLHLGDLRRRLLVVAAALFWTGSVLSVVRNWFWFTALALVCGVTAGLIAQLREDTHRVLPERA